MGPGFVFLDDIQVGQQVWRSASDNGNNAPAYTPAQCLMGEPLNVVFTPPRLGL